MDFNVLSTQNWSKAFSVWIDDIQVVCHPVVAVPLQIRGNILREVRELTRYLSLVVVLLFSLHCTQPKAQVQRPAGERPEDLVEARARVYTETGSASWYGGEDGFAGRPTANGETFDPMALTCAHRTLPFDTLLKVENLDTGKQVVVRVNDRGPFVRGRMIDLSEQAARRLGMTGTGVATVRIATVDAKGQPAPQVVRSGGDPYTVQVGAFADPANIARLTQELREAIGPVTVLPVPGKATALKRVRVGSYATQEEARKASEQIARLFKDQGLEPFVTREH